MKGLGLQLSEVSLSLKSRSPVAQPGQLSGTCTQLSSGLNHVIRTKLPAFIPASLLPLQVRPLPASLTRLWKGGDPGDQHPLFTPPGQAVCFVSCWVLSARAAVPGTQ